MKNRYYKSYIIPAILFILGMVGCGKDLPVGQNPYDGGVPPLDVKFLNVNRRIEAVRPGDKLELSIKGLANQKDKLQLFINEEQAKIDSYTDSTVVVIVPEQVSSGRAKLLVGNQVFYGPRVPIEGKVKFDVNFNTGVGFDGYVSKILPVGGNYYIVGSFTNYKSEAEPNKIFRNSIHIINDNGNTGDLKFGRGVQEGLLRTIVKLNDGKFLIGGNLSSFNRKIVNGITSLNSIGELDTLIVDVLNPNPNRPENAKDTVAKFQGNLFGNVLEIFPIENDTKLYAIGYFGFYGTPDYRFSSKGTPFYNYSRVNTIARLNIDGSLDQTYQLNNDGLNGPISRAVRLSDGKIIIVGGFNSYNKQAVNNILVLNADGTVNSTFAGTGANDAIYEMSYNPIAKKIALVGKFTTYKGVAKRNMVVLNEDGTIDENFKFGDTNGEIPTSVYVMNNGKIIVCGEFEKYIGITRSGMLILESNGTALQDYNNLSGFSGYIRSVVETTSSEGFPALLIGGNFFSIDGNRVGGLMRLEIKN